MNIDAAEVVQATDLPALIRERVTLQPKGRELVGLCPFHDDHSPSLSVVTHKGKPFYKCHACGAGGDVITWVQQLRGCDFRAALKHLADRAGLDARPARPRRLRVRTRILHMTAEVEPSIDFEAVATEAEDAVDVIELARLARALGVEASALLRLRVGWLTAARLDELGTACHGDGTWSFPMANAVEGVVGIRLRAVDGGKFSLRGGREGIFVPTDLGDEGMLCITEGPTDCAALLGVGFSSIGRPSCTGGTKAIRGLARGRDTIIFADRGDSGRRGAEALAAALLPYCPTVRVIHPRWHDDLREWVRAGATRLDVEAVIAATEPRRLTCVRGGTA
ncbi:MAG: CHC2 zinc finger domain-containing protein [Planctomycetota bacterium]|jgi:hypothetical protein